MVLMNDSILSSDAATLRPRKSSLNQYSFSGMKERWSDLVSSTCLAGIRSATSHSEKNSVTRSSFFRPTPLGFRQVVQPRPVACCIEPVN